MLEASTLAAALSATHLSSSSSQHFTKLCETSMYRVGHTGHIIYCRIQGHAYGPARIVCYTDNEHIRYCAITHRRNHMHLHLSR